MVVGAHVAGSFSPVFPVLGALLCFATRMTGVHYGIDAPTAPSRRLRQHDPDLAVSGGDEGEHHRCFPTSPVS